MDRSAALMGITDGNRTITTGNRARGRAATIGPTWSHFSCGLNKQSFRHGGSRWHPRVNSLIALGFMTPPSDPRVPFRIPAAVRWRLIPWRLRLRREIRRNVHRSESVTPHAPHACGAMDARQFPGAASASGMFVQLEKLHMHLHLRRFWPAFVLLIAASSASAATHNVSVGGTYSSGGYTYPQNGFVPAAITVDVGDTVTFTNAGGTHNVDADDETSFRCANGCDGAGGNGDPNGTTWSSTITITPAMAGRTIGYHCDVHGSM